MKKLNVNDKKNIIAGAAAKPASLKFWTACVGSSVVLGAITGLISLIVNACAPKNQSVSAVAQKRKETYVRLSPYPSRSTAGIWF